MSAQTVVTAQQFDIVVDTRQGENLEQPRAESESAAPCPRNCSLRSPVTEDIDSDSDAHERHGYRQ